MMFTQAQFRPAASADAYLARLSALTASVLMVALSWSITLSQPTSMVAQPAEVRFAVGAAGPVLM